MKVNKKLFLAFVGIIVSFSFMFFLFEAFLLRNFYSNQRKENLKNVFNEVTYYTKNTNLDIHDSEFLLEISEISKNTGTFVLAFDSMGKNIYSDPQKGEETIFNLGFFGKKYNNISDLDEDFTIEGKVVKFSQYNDRFKKNTAVIGKFDTMSGKTGYLVIITPYSTINESSNITFMFTIQIILICVVLFCLISIIVTHVLSKPLKEVKNQAQKIANLDFSSKLEVKSRDEFGELAISINKMSSELEKSINDLRNANTKLENDIKLKERIDKLREEFISDVSHELKTPISIIAGYSEALKLEGLDQKDINEYADIIIDEARRMNKLVRDLLKFTQIESGFLTLDNEDFEIDELINQVVKPNELRLQEKQISLKIEVLNIQVNGDYDMMETVFRNIFTNAINHADNDRRIEIKTFVTKNNKLRVEVFNTGSTINDEDQIRIWESFYKADKSRSRQYGGSGLGLAIVKSIMDTYKNEYGTYNRENGVTFYFDLNIADTRQKES